MAKGPAAPFYYAMVYDLNGRERLKIGKDPDCKPIVRGESYFNAWNGMVDQRGEQIRLQRRTEDSRPTTSANAM